MNHVTRELLEAWDRGEVSPEELSLRYQEHALDLCGTCRGDFAQFLRQRNRTRKGRSFRSFLDLLTLLVRQTREWDEDAKQLVEDLAPLSSGERQARLGEVEAPVHRALLAENLLDASLERAAEDAEEARSLARLAFHVALRVEPATSVAHLSVELRTRALALEANALRAGGDLAGANPVMEAALASAGEVEPASRALVLALAASLRRAQRRLDESVDLSDRAYGLARAAALDDLAAKTLIGKSAALAFAGRPDEAVLVVRQALRHIDPDRNAHLYLCARHDHLYFLVESGKAKHARRLLRRLRPLYERFPPHVHLRRRWLEGRIAQGLGETKEAEKAFVEVRDRFIDLDNGYNAALVSLDLAVLYADECRREEMKQLAREMIPIFRAQDVHREAIAALLVFWDAASREAVSHDLLRRLTEYLHHARHDRELRFEE